MLQKWIGKIPEDDVEEINFKKTYFPIFQKPVQSFIEKYKNLIHLNLNNCNLRSLENFPYLPNLLSLELVQNKIDEH